MGRVRWSALVVALVMVMTGCAGCSSSTPTAVTAAAPTATTSTAPATGAPVPSAGCPAATAEPGLPAVVNQRQNIEVDGVQRWYLLNVPSTSTPSPTATEPGSTGTVSAETPRPLVVDFHGLEEGATIHSATSRFGVLGNTDGFIAVFREILTAARETPSSPTAPAPRCSGTPPPRPATRTSTSSPPC